MSCFHVFSRLAYSQDGGAGAIREAGGSFGKKEAADEERYFRKMVGPSLSPLLLGYVVMCVSHTCMTANRTTENT